MSTTMLTDYERKWEEKKIQERNCHPKQLISVRYGVCMHIIFFCFAFFSNESFLRSSGCRFHCYLLLLSRCSHRTMCAPSPRLRPINRVQKRMQTFSTRSTRSVVARLRLSNFVALSPSNTFDMFLINSCCSMLSSVKNDPIIHLVYEEK